MILKNMFILKKSGIPLVKRAEILGRITADKPTIAVAGTHGKTTITSMIAHILFQSELGCTALIGGIINTYQTNFLSSVKSSFHVVEADEYDRSFLQLKPNIAIITATDTDHLDIYSNVSSLQDSFIEFTRRIKKGGHLILKKGLKLAIDNPSIKLKSYSAEEKADTYAFQIRRQGKTTIFNLMFENQIFSDLELNMPGRMNLENAVAASAATLLSGINENDLRNGLKSFKGIYRRFDYLLDTQEMVYIDDYAHHPAEIEALVTSVKQLYPGKRICGIFQPHLYSRTRDLAAEFARALSTLDEAILLPIYPAREKPIAGVDSNMILNTMTLLKKSVIEKENLLSELKEKEFDVLLTIGAGDIDQFRDPIKKLLSENIKSTIE